MKKNNKGFTLIELLAVIIILAIIALIAVPTIMNIIENSRKSAAADSAYGVISAAELWYSEALLDQNGSIPMANGQSMVTVTCRGGTCEVEGYDTGSITDTSFANLNIKGDTPMSGGLTINPTNGTVKISSALVINSYSCNYNDKNIMECNA